MIKKSQEHLNSVNESYAEHYERSVQSRLKNDYWWIYSFN